jgi:hypothetical protein
VFVPRVLPRLSSGAGDVSVVSETLTTFLNTKLKSQSAPTLRKHPIQGVEEFTIWEAEAQQLPIHGVLKCARRMHQQINTTSQPKLQPISAHQAFGRTLTKLFCAAYTCQVTLSRSWSLLATKGVLVAPDPRRSRPHHWRRTPALRGRTGGDVTTMKDDGRGLHATPYRRGHSESSRSNAGLSGARSGMVRSATGFWGRR